MDTVEGNVKQREVCGITQKGRGGLGLKRREHFYSVEGNRERRKLRKNEVPLVEEESRRAVALQTRAQVVQSDGRGDDFQLVGPPQDELRLRVEAVRNVNHERICEEGEFFHLAHGVVRGDCRNREHSNCRRPDRSPANLLRSHVHPLAQRTVITELALTVVAVMTMAVHAAFSRHAAIAS